MFNQITPKKMKKITNIMMAVLLSTATITGLYRQEFNIIYNLQQI